MMVPYREESVWLGEPQLVQHPALTLTEVSLGNISCAGESCPGARGLREIQQAGPLWIPSVQVHISDVAEHYTLLAKGHPPLS